MDGAMPYILGALGGGGVLSIYYGFKQVMDNERKSLERKRGLWLVNLGVVLLGITLALMLWIK
jgi:hypothetical protein